MTTSITPLHVPGRPLVLVNVWDAGSARAVADTGAPALATASWAVAAAAGHADGEQIGLDHLLGAVRSIVAAVDLPLTVDLERGFGERPEDVAATVTRAIEAGAVGANLEDGLGDSLRPLPEQLERLQAAREAATATGAPFHLNARTDVWLLPEGAAGAGDTDEALTRLRAFAEVGADSGFVPGLGLGDDLARVIAEQPLPVNVMRPTAADPTTAALGSAGVARISHGPGPYLAAMQALTTFAEAAR